MRHGVHLLALVLGLGLAIPAIAQEPAPPAKEEAAKPAVQAPVAEAPGPKTEPAPPKELSVCAKALVPLADSYKSAYEDLQKWIADVDEKTAAASDKVTKIQAQIQANETAITKAKLDGDDAKAKELGKANKQLWSDLEEAKKGASQACSNLSKEAAERVKKYEAASDAALDECKARLK